MREFKISPDLEALIPPLRSAEFDALRDQIVESGRARDPLVVWVAPDGARTLLDGHNRFKICSEFGLPFDVTEIPLPSIEAAKAWMIRHQRGRRNLSRDQNLALDIARGVQPAYETSIRLGMARKLLDKAPDLLEKVRAGAFGLVQAHNILNRRESAPLSRTAPAAPEARKRPKKGRIHIVIGDTQIRPGVQTQHLTWIGRYIAEQFAGQNVAIVHLGDHWDMPSLSSYDEGKKAIEGRRYTDDVRAGNEAFARLNEPIAAAMKRGWRPERHFLFGNHEERIVRACNDKAVIDGALSLEQLDTCGWTRHAFLHPLELDGVSYSHYFYHPNTGKPYGGENLLLRLKTIGRSFTMGHQQGRQWVERMVGTRRQCGLICGSTYLHDEEYRGPQGNANWRGIVICHQVEDGQYDPMFVSLDYLCRRYEGATLSEWLREIDAAAE